MVYASFQKEKTFSYTSRETNWFVSLKELCEPDIWMRIEDTDFHFDREIKKSIWARKISWKAFCSKSART